MKRPRPWVVLLGTLAVIGVGALGLGGLVAFRLVRPESLYFADNFDRSIARNYPALSSVLAHDPPLREMMLRQSYQGYQHGGWDEASSILHRLKEQEVKSYAGDDALLGENQAWRNVIARLLAIGHACGDVLYDRAAEPMASEALAAWNAAGERVVLDGGKHRLVETEPDTMSNREETAVQRRVVAGPAALTDAERRAYNQGRTGDALWCRANLKIADNVASLPPALAARYLRGRYRGFQPDDADAAPDDPPAPDPRCPPVGTVFTLSLQASDGLPIKWTAIGAGNGDCRIRSSASGERWLFGSRWHNPLTALGPLAVGKVSAPLNDEEGDLNVRHVWRVAGEARYWLPIGWTHAFRLDDDSDGGPTQHYVVTHYWSPELGFKIGQATRVVSGTLPQSVAPDWQLVAMTPPAVQVK